MSIVVNTEVLKQAVNKVCKCASLNNTHLITTLIGIKSDADTLTLTTTDLVNTFSVSIPAKGEDVSIAVRLEVFSKLIIKSTTPEVELAISNGTLVVSSNGKYNIPISSDETGNVEFPIPVFDKGNAISFSVDIATINRIRNNNEQALAKDDINPWLTGYFFGKSVITTDTWTVSFTDVSFTETPILMNSRMLTLLSTFNAEKADAYYDESNHVLAFYSNNMSLIGYEKPGIENFPYDTLLGFRDMSFDYECKIAKGVFMDALDRLQLFIDKLDDDGALVEFDDNTVTLASFDSRSTETINCESNGKFRCGVKVSLLKNILSTFSEETITIKYGLENALCVETTDAVHIMSLLDME